ncbi:hypothetical protein D3C75_592920 [compost metagenome]
MTHIPQDDQQLNRELAELMGWTNFKEDGNGGMWGTPPDDRWSNSIPDYCNDPAASLEVQAAAMKGSPLDYLQNLQEVKWGNVKVDIPIHRIIDMMNATPRERAMAAWMTLKADTASSSA